MFSKMNHFAPKSKMLHENYDTEVFSECRIGLEMSRKIFFPCFALTQK